MKTRDSKIQQLGLQANIAFCKAMSAEQLDTGEVIAVIAAIKDSMLNVVMDTQSTDATIEATIAAVKSFYQRHQKEWFWIVGPLSKPESLSQHLIKNGLSLNETFSSCYFDLKKPLESLSTPNFIIKEATPEDELYEWSKPLNKAFPNSDQAESFRKLNASLPHGEGAAFHHYVGYFNTKPVCCGTLFVTNNAVMIHNVGTDPDYARKGFGTAMTVHAMLHAKQLGYQLCFLDASENGLKVYQRIGFSVYSQSSVFSIKKSKI